MKHGIRKNLRSLLVLVLCLALLSNLGATLAATGDSSGETARRVGSDVVTKGHWQGVYGSDIAYLFGYAKESIGEGTPGQSIEGGAEIMKDDLIVAGDGTTYSGFHVQVTAEASDYDWGDHYVAGVIWSSYADQNDDSVLDMPNGIDRPKFQALAASGDSNDHRNGLAMSSHHQVYFKSNRDGLHLITLYSNKATVDRVIVTFVSKSTGEELVVDELPVGTFAGGQYITYLIPGNFDFYVEKNNMGDGFTGFFIDPVDADLPTVRETQPKTGASDAIRVNIDTETKGHWEGKYGSTDMVDLFGYNHKGEPQHNEDWEYDYSIPAVTEDYNKKTEDSSVENFTYDISGSLWCQRADQSDESVPDMPKSLEGNNKFNAWAFSGKDSGGLSQFRATFELTMKDDDYHLITLYGNREANDVFYVSFVSKDTNETLLVDVLPKDVFKGGAYVSYLVPGSVTMYVDKPQMDSGFNALFVDKAVENKVSELTAEVGSEKRSVKLSWKADGLDEGQLVVERKAEDAWEVIATLEAGETSYEDKNLTAGATYSYRIRTVDGTTYSVPGESIEYAVPPYALTALGFDKESYTTDSTKDSITVNVTLTKNDGTPCSKQVIYLAADYGHSVQDLGTQTTDDDGKASFSFSPKFLGQANLKASFKDNDEQELMNTSAAASMYVGEKSWTKAPVIWNVSDAVLPGELINLNGYGFKNDDMTKVTAKYAAHTTDNVPAAPPASAKDLTIVQTDARDGYYVVAQLPSTASTGIYDIWVTNGYGYSKPVTLNVARPLFISEYEAWKGQVITISGRNLQAQQFGAATQTQVRLSDGEKVYTQKILKNTPYSIKFEVDAPAGKYAVQVTNDGGISWRALVSEQTLSVVEAGKDPLDTGLAWMAGFAWDNVYDITTYGANGSDKEPDTDAVNAAMAEAVKAGGGVVYIPAGEYYIAGLKVPANIVIRGAGKDATTLYYVGTGENMFESSDDGITVGHQIFADFAIRLSDDNTRPDVFFWLGHPWGDEASYMEKRQPEQFLLKNIDLEYTQEALDTSKTSGTGQQRGYAVVLIAKERFVIQDSSFAGNAAGITHIYLNDYTTYDGVTLDYDEGYLQSTANYLFVENCHITGGLRKSSTRDNHGVFARAFAHIEDNYVEGVGSEPNNDGEPYAVDTPNATYDVGDIINATSNTITVLPGSGELKESYGIMFNRLVVRITTGRGLGQQRQVDSVDPATNTITIKGEWDVIPDATSKMTLICPLEYTTVYHNEMRDSAKGIYLFGTIYDGVAANNVSEDTEGVLVWSANVASNNADTQSSFATIRDNILTGVSPKTNNTKIAVISQRMINGPEYYHVGIYGIEIRKNQITGVRGLESLDKTEAPAEGGIVSWSAVKSSYYNPQESYHGDNTNILIENNTLKSLDTAISSKYWDYGIVMKGNVFSDVGTEVDSTAENQTIVEDKEVDVPAENWTPSNDSETVTNPDGSITTIVTRPDGTKTETTRRTDGTVIEKITQKDGSTTQRTTTPEGVIGQVDTNSKGEITSVKVVIPEGVGKSGTVTAPVEVPAAKDSASAPEISVKTSSAESTRIEIPVTKFGPGTVAVVVDEDGNEHIVRDCVIGKAGVVLNVKGDVTLKILDNTKTFSDVEPVNHWASDAIEFVAARELFNGTGNNKFTPNGKMTRGMLVTVLYRLAYEPETAGGTFTDVDPDAYYADAVSWAQGAGVVDGYGDGSFGPKNNITREQLVTILYRYAEKNGYQTDHTGSLSGYADADSVSGWAAEAMSWAVETGLIKGVDETHLAPTHNTTRAQVATILMRFCENIIK